MSRAPRRFRTAGGTRNRCGRPRVLAGVVRESEEKAARSALAASLPCDDPPRLGQLLSRLEPRLTAVALRLVRDPDAAADVVQEAFEKVLRSCHQFRGSAKPSTWMHRIVVNEAFLWLRRERRHAPSRLDPEDWALAFASTDDPERSAAAREELTRLRRALGRLPAAERRLLTEPSLRGRAYMELARELQLSAGAARLRALRTRRRLAATLDRTGRGSSCPSAGCRREPAPARVDQRRRTTRVRSAPTGAPSTSSAATGAKECARSQCDGLSLGQVV